MVDVAGARCIPDQGDQGCRCAGFVEILGRVGVSLVCVRTTLSVSIFVLLLVDC